MHLTFPIGTYLITGGTGTFGKAFVRELLKVKEINKIIIYSRDEFKQLEMQREFNRDDVLRFFIGDVRDKERLNRAMKGVGFVVHAAALKQVPAIEYNPFEAIKTNVLGAKNVIECAIDNNVIKAIALSTDKSVHPINIYGATKMCSDKLFISGNAYSTLGGTRFAVVRYGNVMGSRGSIIPIFKKMIAEGAKSLPLTHPEMTRFWIKTIEAIGIVAEALCYSRGGETYVKKIPSFRVRDLITAMERDFTIIGLRPGEKLHEEMITTEDNCYEYDGHYVLYPNFSWWNPNKINKEKNCIKILNFSYASNTNTEWLDVEQIKEILKEIK